MAVIGFDFGTTNSLVSIIRGNRPISFLDELDLPTPSVVCYEGSQTIVGRDAKSRLSEAGLGVKGNIVPSPKTLLGRETVDVEGIARSPIEIASEVVKHVIERAKGSDRGKDIAGTTSAVVTIPVNMEGYRRAALRDAFRRAGLRIHQFVHEPLAALYGQLRDQGRYDDMLRQYNRQLLLVVDWGGGTLDITLCRLVDGVLFQIANDGTDLVGGEQFDDAIRNEVRDRVILQRGLVAAEPVRVDAMTRLRHSCESAKIALSERDSAAVYVRSFFRNLDDDSLDYTLTRDELERIVTPLMNQGLRRITGLLERNEVTPAQIGLCLAVGGMANMPAIRTRLHEWFGVQRVHVSRKSASLIAEGAAWIAHDNARLQLSKTVELLLARNSFVPIIRTGTEMPLENQTRTTESMHLYCVDPRDGIAKFQVQTPQRPGVVHSGDPRRVLKVMTIPVDSKARPFQERLELDAEIDENLILSLRARSLNKRGMDEAQIHDLEFSLRLPGGTDTASVFEETPGSTQAPQSAKGALAVRANVGGTEDDALVPGELLYTYKPRALDPEWHPPQIQMDEFLYYQPCSYCRRASNDPLCRCASSPASP